MHIWINILLAFHVLVSLLMVFFVLMQRPRSEGLGAAFGGGMTENIFGAQTTTVLTRITVWLGSAFFALTLLLAFLYAHESNGKTKIQKALMALPVPVASATPAATTPAVPAVPAAPIVPATPATSASPAPAPAVPSGSASPAVEAPVPEAMTAPVPAEPVASPTAAPSPQ